MARLAISPTFVQIERGLYRAVNQQINEALERGARELAAISPRGVSPLGESLTGSWQVEPIRLLENNRGVIRNVAPDALQRMVGSPPGTFVDPRPGGALFRWAQSKGVPARAVSRSILSKGTRRWRTGENPLDLSPSGELRSPDAGVTGRITEDIRRRIMRLRF